MSPPREPASTRTPRSAEATKKRILDAAEHEFAAHGFAGARLREIGRAAAVQPALIHHYFADKDGLYAAVLDRGLELMQSMSMRVLAGSSADLEPLVRGFVDVLVDFYASHEQLLAIVRHETMSGSTLLLDRARERLGPLVDTALALVANRQDEGAIRGDLSPRELVLAALSLTLYPAIDQRVVDALLPAPARDASLARHKQVVVSLLLAAIRPTAAAATSSVIARPEAGTPNDAAPRQSGRITASDARRRTRTAR